MGFRRRQLVTAALTANAIRPIPGMRVGIASFFAGWLTGELAPQVLALTAADAAVHSRGRRRDVTGLALASVSTVGLSYVIGQARRAQQVAEDALTEALGGEYQDVLDARPTPAELATPWRRLVYPFRVRDARVHVERNIAYNDRGRRGLLDVYRPASGPVEKAPVLLQVHGGAWMIGNKEQQGLPLMQHLAAKGWVCVAINYRLSPRDAFPAHVIDVKQAIAWIRTHIAEYGGDPDYIAITGGSAGGHLAALAALTPNDPAWQPGFEDVDTSVACAVPHYGVYDLAGSIGTKQSVLLRDGFLAPKIMQTTWEQSPEAFEAASPVLRVGDDAPDFFVLHGRDDTLVPVVHARTLVELLKAADTSVVYAELPGAQHAFDVFPSIRSAHVVRAIDRYLHWHWNTWRRGLDHTEELTDASQQPEG
ncbi:alpha/beta hydrolase [soil metagenome]